LIRAAAWLAAIALLAGCSTQVNKVVVRPDALPVQPQGKAPRLACGFHLASVEDARSPGSQAGGLGRHQLVLEDAPALVTHQLHRAGMLAGAPTAADAHTVALQIKQLYLTQNLTTKIPMAVYSVQVDGGDPFLVRSQAASMNWNGTQEEAYDALAKALDDASQRLVTALNTRCSTGT
jgi:uncharacterized lipoprotein YajG